MASKGDKALLAPQAQRLYADGHNLSSISELLNVSVTSLSKWKKDTKAPSDALDDWDRARSQKRSNVQRLRDLFEGMIGHLEEGGYDELSNSKVTAISRLGSLVEKWDKFEKTQRVADEVEKVVKKAGLTADTVDDIKRKILGIGE